MSGNEPHQGSVGWCCCEAIPARLFANVVQSQEGNGVSNNDAVGNTAYDTSRLPRQFQFAKPEIIKRKDQIVKLLR